MRLLFAVIMNFINLFEGTVTFWEVEIREILKIGLDKNACRFDCMRCIFNNVRETYMKLWFKLNDVVK